jgi:hypothetical protein
VAMEETLEYQIGWLTVVLTKPPLKKPDHGWRTTKPAERCSRV